MTEQTKTILILSIPSGEHLIADVHEAGGAYLCSSVMQIIQEVDQETQRINMGMIPYLQFSDQDAEIAIPSSIAIVALPSEDLVKYYNSVFDDSVIISPPEPKIILS